MDFIWSALVYIGSRFYTVMSFKRNRLLRDDQNEAQESRWDNTIFLNSNIPST